MARRKIRGLLVIISCGSQKIWDQIPRAGPTPALDAYTSPVFRISRRYAEHFSERWAILSAKYGFMDPAFVITEDYNTSFYDPGAIKTPELIEQVKSHGLRDFPDVAVLGSYAYWDRVIAAFQPTQARLRHINSGIGFPPLVIRLVQGLVEAGTPFPNPACGKASTRESRA